MAPMVIHLNDSHALTAIALAGIGLRAPLRVAARRVMFPIHSAARYIKYSDGLICISQAVAAVARKAGIPQDQIHVVYDGIDPQRMEVGSAEKGIEALAPGDRDVLLYVAALTGEKGHMCLLSAMTAVVARQPQVMLVLAGDGPDRAAIEQRIGALNLHNHVRVLGYRRDIPDLMQASRLFVFPANNEGLGSSVIDAMFAGVPVVCSDSGGTPELFRGTEDGQSASPLGWIVPHGDSARLADAILNALEQPKERQRRAAAAQRHAQRHFVASTMVEQTLAVYNKLLTHRRQRAPRCG